MYKPATLLFSIIFSAIAGNAQKIDSIYVHLYTDSLKKGTYNYINIDGHLSNGKYLPLDSTEIRFSCSHGKFYGNNLWLEPDCKEEKIMIKAVLKSNDRLQKEFVMYVKKKDDNEALKTEQQVMDEIKSGKKKRQRK
jgi:hypothetical protein